MNKIFRNTLAIAMLGLCGTVSAQNLNSAYFLDGYAYGHYMNPAKDYDRSGYVAMPALGHVNVGLNGNLSLTDVLKFNNGGLTTYLNPNIAVKEALSGFSSTNHTNVNLRLDIVSFGFHAWGGYNTFNISARTNVGFTAPYELFEATKTLTNKDYDISGIGLNATAWAEIGFGHSRNVTDAWRVGGKFKILLGGAHALVNVKNAHLNLTAPDKWVIEANAEANISVKGFDWGEMETKNYNDESKGTYEQINFDNVDVNGTGLNGWGLGLDLGAEWDLGEQGWLEGMKISASLLDFGFISWNETHRAYNKGEAVEFTGYNNIQVSDGPGESFDDQSDRYGDRFSDLIALQDGGVSSSAKMLGATMNIGVEYELPYYRKLKFGLLSTTRIQGKYSWNEERISANVSPLKWLEGGINLGFGSLGTSFGWVANIHPRGFNFFVGMDHTMGKLSKQGVPLKSSTSVTLGIVFPFGKSSL